MRIRFALALTLLASPVFAQKVKVEFDKDYPFGEVDIYAWSDSEQRDRISKFPHPLLTSP